MSSDSNLMNELLERIGSDERAVPEAIGPAFYTLFENLLTRIEMLEKTVKELEQDKVEHLMEWH